MTDATDPALAPTFDARPADRDAGTMTLQQLRQTLESRGVPVGYSQLSEFLKTGDIAEQLGAGGTGSRRAFLPAVADVLAAFLPEFRAAGGKTPQAPAMLRSFLKQTNPAGLVPSALNSLVPQICETAKVDPIAVAEAQGRAQGLAQAERVLTAKEAAALLGISPRQLRKTTKPYRRFGNGPTGDRWLLSDLLRPE